MPSLDYLVHRGPPGLDVPSGLEHLRDEILRNGIPANNDGMSEMRIYSWLILLHVPPLSTQAYVDLVHQGASPAYSKIRNDTFRTLATDPLFRRRVTENSLARVLNAVAWRLHDAHEARVGGWQSPPTMGPPTPLDGSLLGSVTASPGRELGSLATGEHGEAHAGDRRRAVGGGRETREGEESGGVGTATEAAAGDSEARSAERTAPFQTPQGDGAGPATRTRAMAASEVSTPMPNAQAPPQQPGYVQGMNVLAAPFLYAARSEAEAYAAFAALVTRELPGYVRGSMDGVHRGLALVDSILAVVDPKLADHLASKGLRAEIYAFAPVLTLSACTPPLPEVLRLWDFLFAWGVHMNVVCVVAQLILIRDQLLASTSPNQILRSLPPLQAGKIIAVAISFAHKIPGDIYDELVNHAK